MRFQKFIFILGSYKFLAYLDCVRIYAWSCGHSDPDLSSVGLTGGYPHYGQFVIELILGTDFLSNNGAIINLQTNRVAFMPNDVATVGSCKKPIIAEAITSLVDTQVPFNQLTINNNSAFILQLVDNIKILHRDQGAFQARITKATLIIKPGTIVMITSRFAPAPYIKEGFYTVKQDNTISIEARNTDICSINLQAGRPIPRVIVHTTNNEYHMSVEIFVVVDPFVYIFVLC